MNDHPPVTVPTLPQAWALAYDALMQPGVAEITPLHISITGIAHSDPEENHPIRQGLDEALQEAQKASTSTVANTIFPLSLWNPERERTLLYDRYSKYVFPAIKRDNSRGTYFQRMIAYCPEGAAEPINQLEQIIETWTKHSNHRHSALQLSIFDPTRDHRHSQQLGFPCLHQVCFTPLGPNGANGLSVTAFYATQHMLTKAYGNYLGLIRLGRFVATALDLQMVRFSCFAAKAVLGDGPSKQSKQDLHKLCSHFTQTT